MSDATEKILVDLPVLQRIALRPAARHPLLEIVLEQAQALREIADWAAAARQLAQQPADGDGAAPAPTPLRPAAEGTVS